MNINLKSGLTPVDAQDLIVVFNADHLIALGYEWQQEDTIEPKYSFDIVAGSINTKSRLALFLHLDFYSKEPVGMRTGSAVGDAVRFFKQRGVKEVAFVFGEKDIERFSRIVDALLTASYSFQQYRQTPSEYFSELTITLYVPDSSFATAESALGNVRLIGAGVDLARDLANHPSSKITPEYLANSLMKVAETYNQKCDVLDENALQTEGYIGHIAVGGGSVHKPFMAVAHYKPESIDPTKPKLALVGKGITFDSGGIDIKPFQDMWLMKADMSGAAAVISAFDVICSLKPSIEVIAIVCCAENMPDGAAYRPSDLLTYRNGKTVEIISTDAEGRLVLADGLIRACEEGATHVVDIATLTGACLIALGYDFTGLFGNDEELIEVVKSASESTGELVWHMPLPVWYRDAYLKSDFCDLKNGGGRYGGAITASNFLNEFVTAGTVWCHLDIAPTFYHDTPKREYLQAGATGVGVRLLTELAMSLGK